MTNPPTERTRGVPTWSRRGGARESPNPCFVNRPLPISPRWLCMLPCPYLRAPSPRPRTARVCAFPGGSDWGGAWKLGGGCAYTTTQRTGVDGALLSLSGNDVANRGYRRNAATSEEGKVVFTDLPPGSYFLRPTHKEFLLQPESMDITVTAGKKHEVETTPPRPLHHKLGHTPPSTLGSLQPSPQGSRSRANRRVLQTPATRSGCACTPKAAGSTRPALCCAVSAREGN